MVTSDRIVAEPDFAERAREVLEAGGDRVVLHLRSRDATGARLFELAGRLSETARSHGSVLAVNDRVDVALAAGLDWVHLGSESLPPRDVLPLFDEAPTLGLSIHGADQLYADRDVDYFMAGNLHETRSHPERKARGADWLTAIADATDRPVVAIGGITPERVAGAVGAGAHGVAVLSGIWDTGAPGDAVSRYLQALNATSRTRS